MKDIKNRSDIERLVDGFYKKAKEDSLIGHFFWDVVELDWTQHMSIICDFWETILLNNVVYQGNPMIKHLELHKKAPLLAVHFERWLTLWESTVQQHFSGPVAQEAINRAKQIAEIMKYKVQQL